MDRDKVLPVTDARKELYKLVKACQLRSLTYVITSDGKAIARLLSEAEYESLRETLEVLSDKTQIKRLTRALKHVEQGKLFSHEAVFGHPQDK